MSYSDIMPSMVVRKLNYLDDDMLRTNAGGNFEVFRFRANSVFDPDPLILSGGIAGFSELAALYNYYRVTHLEFEWACTNNESFPVQIGCVFSNTDIAASIATQTQAHNALENGYSTQALLLSAKGGQDRILVKGKLDLASLWGNRENYLCENSFSALTNANPVQLLYINFIISTGTASLLANGVTSSLKLKFTTQFYSRITNLS